nr:hypothetical protein [Candidatus Gracilibacteria bacterium]
MKKLYTKALAAYLEMLEIHIDTKTKDVTFHEKTNVFYDTLFDVAHKIGERYVDSGGDLRTDSLTEKKKRANKIISDLKMELEKYDIDNNLSLGTQDLIGGLADELEDIEGTSKAFL